LNIARQLKKKKDETKAILNEEAKSKFAHIKASPDWELSYSKVVGEFNVNGNGNSTGSIDEALNGDGNGNSTGNFDEALNGDGMETKICKCKSSRCMGGKEWPTVRGRIQHEVNCIKVDIISRKRMR
jgi:hypothetical protein